MPAAQPEENPKRPLRARVRRLLAECRSKQERYHRRSQEAKESASGAHPSSAKHKKCRIAHLRDAIRSNDFEWLCSRLENALEGRH